MSYGLYDSTGPIAEFASIGGLRDFRVWVEKQGVNELQWFIDEGFTRSPKKLASAIAGLTPSTLVKEQYVTLLEAAHRAEDLLILSDGETDTEDDVEWGAPETAPDPPVGQDLSDEDITRINADDTRTLAESEPTGAFGIGYRAGVIVLRRATDKAFTLAAAAIPKPNPDATPAQVERWLMRVPVALEKAVNAVFPEALAKVFSMGQTVGAVGLAKAFRKQATAEPELATLAKAPRTPRPSRNVGSIKIKFDDDNPEAATWAKKHAAELATGLSDTTRKRIATSLASAFTEGNYDSNFYKEVRSVVRDRKRADTIAHHESMTAMSEGQRQQWENAQKKGLLGSDVRRRWIATSVGACPTCEALDGTTAPLNGWYPWDGRDGPPQHVNCRCTEAIDEESMFT